LPFISDLWVAGFRNWWNRIWELDLFTNQNDNLTIVRYNGFGFVFLVSLVDWFGKQNRQGFVMVEFFGFKRGFDD
jgi:hypothetical protein